jgi:hypothetical protein
MNFLMITGINSIIRTLIILGLITTNFNLLAQHNRYSYDYNSRPQNVVFINLFGDVSQYSINYERIFYINDFFLLSGRLGLGHNKESEGWIMPSQTKNLEEFITIPHHITGNLGKGRHFFEFGFGATFIGNYSGNISPKYLVYPIVGYRLHPINSQKMNFRFSISYPLKIPNEIQDIFIFPASLSFGFSF